METKLKFIVEQLYGQYEVAAYMCFKSIIITFLHILQVPFFITVYMVLFLLNNVIYVFLLLRLCILIVCLCMATLAEVFPSFFLSCQANASVKPAKNGHGPHSSQFLYCSMYILCCSMYFCVVLCIDCFVSFSVLFVCICVLYYCHLVATQLQLNISQIMRTFGCHDASLRHRSYF